MDYESYVNGSTRRPRQSRPAQGPDARPPLFRHVDGSHVRHVTYPGPQQEPRGRRHQRSVSARRSSRAIEDDAFSLEESSEEETVESEISSGRNPIRIPGAFDWHDDHAAEPVARHSSRGRHARSDHERSLNDTESESEPTSESDTDSASSRDFAHGDLLIRDRSRVRGSTTSPSQTSRHKIRSGKRVMLAPTSRPFPDVSYPPNVSVAKNDPLTRTNLQNLHRPTAKKREIDMERNLQSGFRHPHLDYTRREIRLIQIVPGAAGRHLECQFVLGNLNDVNLNYTALSYTWGDANEDSAVRPIILGQKKFWIRSNMFDFLELARSDPHFCNRLYWIDALCIDQVPTFEAGSREKNHQVNMMGQIYSYAREVICWLGEIPESSEARDLGQLRRYLEIESKSNQRADRAKLSRAMDRLIACEYWTRMWVLQEILVARRAVLMRGDFSISWRRFSHLFLQEEGTLEDGKISNRVRINGLVTWSGSRGRPPYPAFNLLSMLFAFREQSCSDPRDKVYALLGVLDRPPVLANYDRPSVQLYGDLVKFGLENRWFLPNDRQPENTCDMAQCAAPVLLAVALAVDEADMFRVLRHLEDVFRMDHRRIHPFSPNCVHHERYC